MDEVDLKLIMLLMNNSRTPYRELADEVDLSVNAVHSRVQNMMDMDIIQEFYTKISLRAFKGVTIISVEGKSNTDNLEQLLGELGEDENTFKVASASGNYLYVHGLLKDATALNEYTERIKEKAGIRNPSLFMPDMTGFKPLEDFEYSNSDYEIIYSMHKNSRKPFSEVADDVGLTSKTVRRRVDRMENAGAVDFSIKIRPTQSSDFITFFEMKVKPEYDRKRLMTEIKRKYPPNITSIFIASNSPNRMVGNVWTKTLDKIHKLKAELKNEGYFDSIKSRLYYNGKEYDTWRDDLLREKATS